METKLIILVVIVLLLIVGFSGCIGDKEGSENNPKVMNLGDSITYGDIKITFLSATWETTTTWTINYKYVLTLKGENIGLAHDSVFVMIKKYEMANGYTYSSGGFLNTLFSLQPGRNSTKKINSDQGGQIIDREFLPVAKIYVTLDLHGNPYLPPEKPFYIVLNA